MKVVRYEFPFNRRPLRLPRDQTQDPLRQGQGDPPLQGRAPDPVQAGRCRFLDGAAQDTQDGENTGSPREWLRTRPEGPRTAKTSKEEGKEGTNHRYRPDGQEYD